MPDYVNLNIFLKKGTYTCRFCMLNHNNTISAKKQS